MKLKLYLRKEFRIKEQIWIRLHVLMLDLEMISSHYQTLTWIRRKNKDQTKIQEGSKLCH